MEMYDAPMADSFIPPDADQHPHFSCETCGIYANVRGAVLVGLIRVQAQRCQVKGHQVETVNFVIDPDE